MNSLLSTVAPLLLITGSSFFSTFFAEWDVIQKQLVESIIPPQDPVAAEQLFDQDSLKQAQKRIKIRDLTSAITREFFIKNFRRGEILLAQLKELKPTDGTDIYFQAILEFEKRNLAQSIFLLEECVTKNDQLDVAWNMLGYLYSKAQNQTKALPAFAKAITLEPYHPVYRYNYARALWLADSPSAALDQVKKVLELRDNMAEAYFLAGLILEDMNKTNDAITNYRKAEERGLKDDDFYVRYFKLAQKMQSNMDLVELLDKTATSGNADLIRLQVTIRSQAGEYQRALQYSERLLRTEKYIDDDLKRTGQLICQADSTFSSLTNGSKLQLGEVALRQIQTGYEDCQKSRRKGPEVRDPVLEPTL